MAEQNQSGTTEVTVTVVKNEYGDWSPVGKPPIDFTIDSEGMVTINPQYVQPRTIATSISTSETKESNAAEADVQITNRARIDSGLIDQETMKTIGNSISKSDWIASFGDEPLPPGGGKAKEADPAKPIVITKPDGSTIVIPPKDPRVKTFVIRYVHWDGTAREYVVQRTEQGWTTKTEDGCKPKVDPNGVIVTINASCTRTAPVATQSAGRDHDDGDMHNVVCKFNTATNRYELFDTVGDFGAGISADGKARTGVMPPAGMDLQEWFRSRIGFTGVPCTVKDQDSQYKPKKTMTISDSRTDITTEVRTTWAVRDYTRTVEVNAQDNLIVRIPSDSNRPVIGATLTFEATEVKRTQRNENGELEEVDDNGKKTVQVTRRNNVYEVVGELPGFVKFNKDTGVFSIPARNIVDNSEVRLDYKTLVRVGKDGGIIGVYTDEEGTWQEVTESTVTKMNKEALSFIDPKFTLLPPDIATYKTTYLIMPPQDTGTTTVDVKVYNENEELILTGSSHIDPAGIAWIVTGDSQGYVTGNTLNGNITLQRSVFNSVRKGKIVATSWDKTKTMSKQTILEIDETNGAPAKEQPGEDQGIQPARPFMETNDGTVSVSYLDSENTWSGTLTITPPNYTTPVVLSFRRTKDWSNFDFGVVSGENAAFIKSQIKVNRVPDLKFTIPHWVIKDYSDVIATASGNPEKAEEWVEVTSSILSGPFTAETAVGQASATYDFTSNNFVITPTEDTYLLNIKATAPNGDRVVYRVMEVTLGTGEKDWQFVDEHLVPQGYSAQGGKLTVQKENGRVTIKNAGKTLKKQSSIQVEARGKNPEGEPTVTNTNVLKTPDWLTDDALAKANVKDNLTFEKLHEEDAENKAPHIRATQRGIEVNIPDDGKVYTKQRIQVALQKDGSSEPTMFGDFYLTFNKTSGEWEIDNQHSFVDSPITNPIRTIDNGKIVAIDKAAMLMHYVNYNVDIGTDIFALPSVPNIKVIYVVEAENGDSFVLSTVDAGLTNKDKKAEFGPFTFSNMRKWEEEYTVFSKDSRMVGPGDDDRGVAHTMHIHPNVVQRYGATVFEEANAGFRSITQDPRGKLLLPLTRKPFASLDQNFITMPNLAGVKELKLVDTRDGRETMAGGVQAWYDYMPTVGRLVFPQSLYKADAEDTVEERWGEYVYKSKYLGKAGGAVSIYGDLTGKGEGFKFDGKDRSVVSNLDYMEFNNQVDVKAGMFGLKRILISGHDTQGNLVTLDMRPVRQRVKVKDAPVAFYVWNDEGVLPLTDTDMKDLDETTRTDIKTNARLQGRKIPVAANGVEPLNLYMGSIIAAPKTIAEVLKGKYAESYLDELVPNKSHLTTRLTWERDATSSENSAEFYRVLTNSDVRIVTEDMLITDKDGNRVYVFEGANRKGYNYIPGDNNARRGIPVPYDNSTSKNPVHITLPYVTEPTDENYLKEVNGQKVQGKKIVGSGTEQVTSMVRHDLAKLEDIEIDGKVFHVSIGFSHTVSGMTSGDTEVYDGSELEVGILTNTDKQYVGFIQTVEDLYLNLPMFKVFTLNDATLYSAEGVKAIRLYYGFEFSGGWMTNHVDYQINEITDTSPKPNGILTYSPVNGGFKKASE